MKNTAPIGLGIVVVAGLFGFVGGAMAFVMYGIGFFAALVLAGVIATVVGIILLLGWRAPAKPPVTAGTAGIGAGNAPGSSASNASSQTPATAEHADPKDTFTSEGGGAAAHKAPVVDTPLETPEAIKVASSASDASPHTSSTAEQADPNDTFTSEGGGAAALKAPVVDTPLETPEAIKAASADGGVTASGSVQKTAKKVVIKPKSTKVADVPSKDLDEDPGEKPVMLTAARDGGADDLKQIKGVGPKMETMLNEMGVYHFDQVAKWTSAEVAWVDQNLKGFKGRVSRDHWVDQATTLAAGGETAFSSKVEKGGVY